MLGCLIVFLASAGTSAVFVLEQVHTVVQDLKASKALKVDPRALAPSYYGSPETLLMVGDDRRAATRYYPHAVPHLANEMLLVRIDPSKPWISMMSIPRELWVPITPPNGATYTNRLNSAYTWGATTLVQTIKQITGLSVNHVIATTFAQFEHAINTLGCVYDTVDERYYHNNANGGDQYQNIDLQPGYQCLNGSDAEQFVSYRHTDSSQIRDSRDQSFLLAVKQQYGPQLAGNVGTFEKVFGKTVQTDTGLRSQTEILNLANLLISAAGLHVRQVHFQAGYSFSAPPGDLTATPQEIQQSVHDFLYGGQAPPDRAGRGDQSQGQPPECARAPAADANARVERRRREGRRSEAAVHRRVSEGSGRCRERDASRTAVHPADAALHPQLRDPRPRPQCLSDLRGGVLQRGPGPVLRRAGNDMDERAAVRQPQPDAPCRQAHV